MNQWMEHLNTSLKNKPIIHLAIPGAHDAMTYTITPSSEVAPDNEPAVTAAMKVFGKLGRRYMNRWCITQDVDLKKQLNLGIRYFDFRVATKSDNNFYFCHGLYGSEVLPSLKVIDEFLNENKGEIMILDFQHFYGFSKEHHDKLINNLIKGTFGNKLCPFTSPPTNVTLNWMLEKGYRVVVIYRDKPIENQHIEGLWPGPAWPTPWPNTTSVNTLQKFLKDKLAHRDSNKGFVTQCLLTPDAQMLAFCPFSNLRKKCANPVYKKIAPWLKEQHPGPGGVNVVLGDFVSHNGLHDLVINLNNFYAE